MENTRLGNPTISEVLHLRPSQMMFLAPMNQHGPPEPNHPVAKYGQTIGVSR
jgi:hypothetical protein